MVDQKQKQKKKKKKKQSKNRSPDMKAGTKACSDLQGNGQSW